MRPPAFPLRPVPMSVRPAAWCVLALLTAGAGPAPAGPGPAGPGPAGPGRSLIELTTPHGPVRGRLEARTDAAAWLLTPAGVLEQVPLAGVTDFRRLAPRFAPLRRAALAAQLRGEPGPGGAAFQTRHYLVLRHASRTPGTFGAKLERTHAALCGWFARRGVRLSEPEFPLIAVVLPDFESFAAVAAADGVARSPGRVPRSLKGYYSPRTNRLTLWEPPGGAADPRFHATLTHEAVHQLASNGGLHHRTGGTPRWVAEGLATALENPAFLSPAGSTDPRDRVNAARLHRFRAAPRPPGWLEDLVCGEAGDARAAADPSAFYADAWAATFFLMHARGPRYARYLQRLGAKTAADPDGPADRRAEFQAAFGAEPARLEGELGRFVDGL